MKRSVPRDHASVFGTEVWDLYCSSLIYILSPLVKQSEISTVLAMSIGDLSVFVEIGEEETVNERGFPQTRFSGHHQSELETPFHGLPMHLLR